jgi:hypothetical protein
MPGFNIANFSAVVNKRGVLRPNKFLMRFNPSFLSVFTASSQALFSAVNRELEFWCDSASIPGVSLSLRQLLRYGYGPVEKKPVAPIFNDVAFTIINDGASYNLEFFQQWLMFINRFDLRTGDLKAGNPAAFELEYKKYYATGLQVYVYNTAGINQTQQGPVMKVTFREAYPIHIADTQLNWADNQNIMRIPVTFTFHDWYLDDLNG